MARWRVVLELVEEYPDAGRALQAVVRQFGTRVVRVVSRVSDEIGQEEYRTRRRRRPALFLDDDEEDA